MRAALKIYILFFVCLWFIPLLGQNIDKADSLELVLHVSDNELEKVDILIALAEEYLTNRPDRAKVYVIQADSIAEDNKYENGQLHAWRIMAHIYWKSSDYKMAISYANRAMKQATNLENLEEKAAISRIFGYIFSDLGDYEMSAKYMFESMSISEELDDKIKMSEAISAVGYLYFEQEQYDKAFEYYVNALAISREVNDPRGIARQLNNIAAIYGIREDFDNVKRYLFDAVKLNREIGQRYWEGTNYMNLGFVNLTEQHYDSSYFYYKKAIGIFVELDHKLHQSNALIGLSSYYVAVDSLAQSEIMARRAFRLGKDHNIKRVAVNAAEQLHRIYDLTNKLDSAHYYGILHYQLKDSLRIEQSVVRLSQLELMYEFNKINQEKILLEQQKEYKYFIAIISLAFVLIVIVVFFSMRQRIRKKNNLLERKQLETELEIKNKELTSNVMSLMRKNEVLSDIANKLVDVQKEAVKDETKTAIGKIARELQKTSDDEIWEEFDTRFKQVHGEFYNELIARFPDLSPNEQKLCAFLRLNMTTKEISELTGQRVNTLEIARSRLRKKLGLSHTKTNLVSFLSQI